MDIRDIIHTLWRPFVWLTRIRNRCGYGVHSPFAFELITQLIYERTPYYAYRSLRKEEKKLAHEKNRQWRKGESLKEKQLLFRLVNRVQPHTLVDAGRATSASLYLQAAKSDMDYLYTFDLSELFLEAGAHVDFLYLHCNPNSETLANDILEVCLNRITSASVFVIKGIHANKEMKKKWKELCNNNVTGVTFDLYDLGIVFFDKSLVKQHYIVNF